MHDPLVENLLREWEVPFEYNESFPLRKIKLDPLSDTQVRHGKHQGPKQEVDQYARQLQAGTQFPAVLIRRADNLLFDGNTRYKAHEASDRPTIPVYICDVTDAKVIKRISVANNQRNGKRMTKAEVLDYVRGMNGMNKDAFVRDTGWSKDQLEKIHKVLEFDERVRDHDMRLSHHLADGVKQALLDVSLVEPFKKLVIFADSVLPTRTEVKRIVRSVNAASSEADANKIIDDAFEEFRPRIEQVRAGLVGPKQTMPQLLALHLGWVVNQKPAGLNDVNLATRKRSSEWIDRAIATLTSAKANYYGEDDDEG